MSRFSGLRQLDSPGFRRLIGTRVAAQFGDGVFQAGLGSAVLFNPEREADPAIIAGGLAVLLLPYSLVGPFAGALLDRWDRRRVLIAAGILKALLIAGVAMTIAAGGGGVSLYVGALLVTAVSRFVLACFGASLPRVVPYEKLVEANSLAATLGAATAVAGAGVAIGLRELMGAGDEGSGWVTAAAMIGALLSAALAAGFARGSLGPPAEVTIDAPVVPVGTILRDFRHGVHAAAEVRSVGSGMIALGAHRLCFGVATLSALLLYRNSFDSMGPLRDGIAGVGQALTAGALGVLLAAFCTPILIARVGRRRTVRGALVVSAGVTLGLAVPMQMVTVLLAAFALALTGQVIKLSLDAAVQQDIGDERRGRVFSLYDTVFNVSYVVAVALGALLVPESGKAAWLLAATTLIYLAAWVAHIQFDRTDQEPKPESSGRYVSSTTPSPSGSAVRRSQPPSPSTSE